MLLLLVLVTDSSYSTTQYAQKKLFFQQRREVKEQKDEADAYLSKQSEMEALKTRLTLWKIWRIKHAIQQHEAATRSLSAELDLMHREAQDADEEILENKKAMVRTDTLSFSIDRRSFSSTRVCFFNRRA